MNFKGYKRSHRVTMSRAKGDPSPERHHAGRRVAHKTRPEFIKVPKDKDSKSELSTETPSKQHHGNLQYENTFKMSPDDGKHFAAYKVEHMMKEILKTRLDTETYNKEECSRLAQQLCSHIKDKSKELGFSRYKLVTQVMVGQDSEQSVQLASRCLWNHNTDNFAAATFRNNSLYAIAVVYGIYLD